MAIGRPSSTTRKSNCSVVSLSAARIDPALHARAVEAAAALGVSLNQFVERAITHEIRA
ncbi:MAG TPA: YlcI/YnfO family protein [Luteibacter sp.]|nr:YlcI/YnfO family protein [Luteibacter sp.]